MIKLLIANRGEIACRVIKTARRMGVRTVAVYSEADANARHVRLADRAVCIGPAAAREVLPGRRQDHRCCQSAPVPGHPSGLRLPSENADFAERCATEGLIFVGPPASSIAPWAPSRRPSR